MYDVICLLGPAGSGKDTLAQALYKTNPDKFSLTVSATTRPPREGEVDGINYHFLTREQFNQTSMIEFSEFNNWFYGTPEFSLSKDKCNIVVINPQGIRDYLDRQDILNIKGIFVLSVSPKTRLLRQLNREENPNVDEIIRRYNTDNHDFTTLDYLSIMPVILNNETEDNLQFNVAYILDKIN